MVRRSLAVFAVVLALGAAPALAGTYNLTDVSTSGGSVTTPVTGSFPTGTAVPLTATSASFCSWQLLNSSGAEVTASYVTNPTSATSASLASTVPADNYTLIANYGYILTIVANQGTGFVSGTVTPATGAAFPPGAQVTLAATTDATHGFGHWQISPTGAPATDLTGQILSFGDVTNPAPHANLVGTGYSFIMPNYDLTITYTMSGKGYAVCNPKFPPSQATYNINMTGAGSFFMPTQSFTCICNPTNSYGLYLANNWYWTITAGSSAAVLNGGVGYTPYIYNGTDYNDSCGPVALITPSNNGLAPPYVYTASLTNLGPGGMTIYSSGGVVKRTLLTISPSAGGVVRLWNATGLDTWTWDANIIFPAANPGYVFSGFTYAPITGSFSLSPYTVSGYNYYAGGGRVANGTNNPIYSDTANFTLINYPAVALANNLGLTSYTPTVTGGPTYHYGDTPTLTAPAITGYSFIGWTVSGGSILNSSINLNQAVLTVQGSAGVVANYAPNSYSLTLAANSGVTSGAGTLSVPASAAYNSTVTITESPGTNQAFGTWTITDSNGQNPVTATAPDSNGHSTFTMPAYAVIISANFVAPGQLLKVLPSTGGAVTLNPNQTQYAQGVTVQMTPAPSAGYFFTNSWTILDTNNDTILLTLVSGSTYSFSMPNYATSVTAYFALIPIYSSTTAITGGGTITVPAGLYTPGQVISISATAAQGYTFIKWLVTGTSPLGSQNSATTTLTVNGNFNLTAVFAVVPVQLQLSGGFNEDTIIGPIVLSQASANGKNLPAWEGYERQGLALLGYAGWNGFYGDYLDAFICDTSANDHLSTYTYNGVAYTGTQALPENGLMNSLVDGRTYMIASASGNALLPGDWIDPAYNQSLSGTVIPTSSLGGFPLTYGLTTYTASNPILNTMVVGQDTYFTNWTCSSLTASFTPGYYKVINFAMKAGSYWYGGGSPFGAMGAKIWANYDSGPSQLLYSFVQGEMTSTNVNAANFNTLDTCGYSAQTGGTVKNIVPLYEFSSPRTLDSTRQLTSISLSYANGALLSQLAVYGATVNPFVPGYIQLNTTVTSGPLGAEGTVYPGYAYVAPGTSLTITATAVPGFNFVDWIGSDSGAIIGNATASQTILTTGSNTCLLTASFTPQACTLAVTTSGPGTVSVPAGPYYPGQYVPVTVTPNPYMQLSSETLVNCTYASNSLLLSGSATARFNFTPINYSVLGQVPQGGGTVSPVSTTATYGQVINIVATTASHYTFTTWNFDANVLYDPADLTAASTTVAVIGNTVLLADFTAVPYSGSEADLPSNGGSITVTIGGPYTYGQVVILTAVPDLGYRFLYWTLTGSSTLSDSTALTTLLTVYDAFTLTANFAADTLTASATLDNAWVYQNMPATTLNRQCQTMLITVQDTWPDTSYTAVVTQSGSGVVVPSLTGVAANGVGAVTPTTSFVFSGSSATLYLVGGPVQADGVTGTGSCTVTVQVTGNSSAQATTTTQAMLTVRRLGDATGNGSVTTADRVQLRKWFNGLPTPNQTIANFDLDGDGAVTAYDLMLLNDLLNHLALPPTPLTLTTATSPPGAGAVTVTPSRATYHYGDQTAIAAVAYSGYEFSGWTVTSGTVANPAAVSTSLTMQGNVALTANYGQIYYLTMSLGPQGTAVVTPSQAHYYFGDQVTVTMSTITAGNVLDHWALSGPGALSNSGALSTALTFAAGNATLSAVYATGSYVNNLSPVASDNNVGSLAAPFKTIGKALTKVRAAQAQSIVIQQGIYREAPGATVTGAAGNPITLKSNPGDRVVITGADLIPQASNSWTLCDSTTASGNANFAHIYYTDVDWSGCITQDSMPFRFSEDEQPLLMAQTPSNGPPSYWAITGSGTSTGTLIDTAHLTQADSTYWLGSKLFYFIPFSAYGTAYNQTITITAYDPATSTLTFTPSNFGVYPGSPARYFLYGSPKLLGGPGQWAVEALSVPNHTFRVWVWPTGDGRPDGHLYQATRRGSTGSWGLLDIAFFAGNPAYYILDGLEVCNGTANGIQVAGSSSVSGSGGNHIVRNCVTHDNDWCGVYGIYNLNGQYIHNLVVNNGAWYGHQFGGEGGCGFQTRGVGWSQTSMNETFQENEIGWNACDGMYLATCGLNIVGNYIHHNGQFGHCDGIQLCIDSGVVYGNSTTVMNNLFNANGDIMQSNDSVDVQMQNNVALDTLGWGFQSQCLGLIWNHNTIVGLGCLTEYPDDPLTITNNLFDMGQPIVAPWSTDDPSSYFSDSNLIYQGPGVTMASVQAVYSGSWTSWSHYLAISGMDVHTITNSSPLMNAAPPYLYYGPGPDLGPNGPGYSASTLYLPTAWKIQDTQVGDNIEINGDGVLRQVTNVNLTNSVITFTPSCAAKLFYDYAINVNNWKSQVCTTKSMDVALQATSPAKGKGQGGTDIGTLNFKVADYCAGKLNGASKRVLPLWPPAPVTLAATGWKYKNGGTAYALTEGGTYTNPNMTGFQLTLGAPLYPLSCTNSVAVTVVDNTGTTYPINAATLDSTGTVLTITLTGGALPRTKTWIQVNVGPALMGANGTDPTVGTNGGPVLGVKSMRFTIN